MGRKPEGKSEKLFKKIGKKIDKLLLELDDAKEHAKVEYADRIEELKRNAETLKNEANKFKESHQDVFDDIEKAMDKAGKELKDVFDRTFKKK